MLERSDSNIIHLSFGSLPAFLAPAVGADDTDAITVAAKPAVGPIVVIGFFIRDCIRSSLSLVNRFGYGLIFFCRPGCAVVAEGFRQLALIFLAAFFATTVRTDHADAVSVAA